MRDSAQDPQEAATPRSGNSMPPAAPQRQAADVQQDAPRPPARDFGPDADFDDYDDVDDDFGDGFGLSEPPASFDSGLDRILEIPLTIHVELGRKKLKIRQLMEVGAGAVLTLDTQAGAALSIYANNTLIAEGEAVVVGERYGVRVTDIVSPAERVRRLGGND